MLMRALLSVTALTAVSACATVPAPAPAPAAPMQATTPSVVAATADVENSAELAALFEQYDADSLAASPASKAYRGIRDEDYGKWDDQSDAADIRDFQMTQDYARRIKAEYDPAQLSPQDALSVRLFEAMAQRSASLHPYRKNGYIYDQMRGAQSQGPAFLINIHSVSNAKEARDYISRIGAMSQALDTLTMQSAERAANGVMPPKWVYPYVISDVENLLGAGNENAVLKDFYGKVDALKLTPRQSSELQNQATQAWNTQAVPAYQRLLAEMKRQETIAPTDDGVWRLPDGANYYDALLANYTTTSLSADEIHAIGLREVERIHGEMREIMQQVGFDGSLQEFFEYTRTGEEFFYDTRAEYLADAEAVLAKMNAKLPEYFATLPTDPLVIKPVEAFREKSAGKAFYQRPAPDGSRPGTYYVNLYNLKDMSKNELEALAYHEGAPGHHLQLSIQTGLGDVPPFRRFGGVTAYSEGWGLYSEELGKDMGFYTDPYSDFGRLGMELWRAARLVVDTGIHHKRWSREKAIGYLTENTPNPDGDIRKAIERYIVYPGQATAYMIGKLKIMELRDRASTQLGDDFDIRAFHDVILKSGPVPLAIMEENVDAWIASEMG
ncbi:Prolyl oligopeptidase [Alteripontixanthobacter maritimus]|uniref:Prolyl oligopeptidase n=1 Tax=Alteripontixanthobacter maritimus TaxID=2161824 RepID=A0A369Q8H8_9SPHN|nr:DUF885 domain-containing protein [Alteripontixanthobacter maritimus]RDC61191.1 Prolyl oligopeptidase [Alteripontixanthobacter maritimus]